MKEMKKIVLAVLLLTPALAFANPGYYAQFEVGPALATLPGGGIGINVGYLWGNDSFNYGIEGGVLMATGGFIGLNTTGVNLDALGVAKYTFHCGFLTFAKLGLTFLHQTVSDDFGNTASIDGFGPTGVLGIGYQFNPNWELDLSANGTLADAFDNVSDDELQFQGNSTYSAAVLIGLTYHFA